MRPTWALPAAAVVAALGAGCSGSDAACGAPGEPLETRVTMTTPADLGELEGLQTVCVGRADDGTPILSARLRFHREDSTHTLTVVARLPSDDVCDLLGAEHDVEAIVRASPTTATHPTFMEATGRLRIDQAFPVAGGDGVSAEGDLYFDGTGRPPVDDPDDFGFRFSAPPCE